jgi:hypothetical protein
LQESPERIVFERRVSVTERDVRDAATIAGRSPDDGVVLQVGVVHAGQDGHVVVDGDLIGFVVDAKIRDIRRDQVVVEDIDLVLGLFEVVEKVPAQQVPERRLRILALVDQVVGVVGCRRSQVGGRVDADVAAGREISDGPGTGRHCRVEPFAEGRLEL